MKRDKWVNIKVSEDERHRWQAMAQAEGVTLADLIRLRLDTPPVNRTRIRRSRRADPQLLAWLGRLNSNLNMIAKWVNTYKGAGDAAQVLQALIAIERRITEAAATHTENEADHHGSD